VTAFSFFAFHPYFPLVKFNKIFGYGESKTCSFLSFSGHAFEFIEDFP